MPIKTNAPLPLGSPVTFRAFFRPETRWFPGGWVKSWRGYLAHEQPQHGIFLGWRSVYDGKIWYGSEVDPTSFTPSGSHRVMLVACDVRSNPIYVRGEDAELVATEEVE